MESATVTATQTFDVPEGEPVTLVVDNPVGDITIRQGASDQVEVTYTKKVYGLSQAAPSAGWTTCNCRHPAGGQHDPRRG